MAGTSDVEKPGVGARARRLLVRALVRPDGRGPALPRLRGRVPFVGAATALLVDAVEFQRTGHAALGEVFSTSMFGLPLTFVGGAEPLARFAAASDEELDLIGAYRRLLGRLLGEDLFVELGPEMQRALSGTAVRRLSGPLADLATDLLRARIGVGGDIDVLTVANSLVMHMACRYVCGDFLDAARCEELAGLFHLLESDFSVVGMFLPIETRSMRRRKAARDRILEIFEGEVRRAAAGGAAEPDGYMQAVLDHSLPADRAAATPAQIRTASLAIMGAVFGAHTNTAITLAASLCDLLDHPQVLAQVERESSDVLATAKLDLAAVCRMPMLLRAINESMRLHGNGGLWRVTRRDVDIGGRTVPAGSLVGTSMGLVNLDGEFYGDPSRYDPDRYTRMKVDDLQSPPVKDRHFGVFGVGRHLCPGRRLAYTMVGTALTVLLRDYRLEPRKRPRGWLTLMTAGMARPLGGFVVRATPR